MDTDLVQKKKSLKHPVKLCEAKFIVTLIHIALHKNLDNNYDQVRKKPAFNAESLYERHQNTKLLATLLYYSEHLPLTPITVFLTPLPESFTPTPGLS